MRDHPRGAPRQLRLVELPDQPPLEGPVAASNVSTSPRAVTGGGLVAVVDPFEGLLGIWEGATRERLQLPAIGGLSPELPGTGSADAPFASSPPLETEAVFRAGGGAWERRVGGGDSSLLERGCLLDSAPAVLVGRWVDAEAAFSPGVARLHALTLGEISDARMLPAPARERARAGRFPELPIRLHIGDREILGPSVQALDDAACGVLEGGGPEGPFVQGLKEGNPLWLGGTALAEVAIGALSAGRPELALALLGEAAGDEGTSALALVHLGGRLAEWTGEARLLLPWRPRLDRAVEALLSDATDPGRSDAGAPAAFPVPQRALEELSAAVEPLGGSWAEELKGAARAIARNVEPRGSAQPRGMALPVLGSPARIAEAAPPRPPEAQLPSPRSFAPLDAASVAAQRTLHAARGLRAWVEGALGVRPDGAWGRLRLAPDLPALVPGEGDFVLTGLRMSDVSVELACRLDGSACTFRLFQDGGRVPVNVVFEPRLPFAGPLRVTIGGEEAEVRTTAVEGGVRLSLQFPLDPERRIVIEQRR